MKPIVADPHLQAALRHAPDAQLAAPAEVSAQILAAAHRSTHETPRQPAAAPTGWKLRWLPWWRQPQASAAMATVLLAGVVGLLWRDEQPGPASQLELDPGSTAQAPLPAAPAAGASPPETLPPEALRQVQAAPDRFRERDQAARKSEAIASSSQRVRSTPAVAADLVPQEAVADQASNTVAERPTAAQGRPPAASPAAAVAAVAVAPPPLPPAVTVAAAAAAPAPVLTGAPSPATAQGARTSGAPSALPAAARLAPPRPAPVIQALDGWAWEAGLGLRFGSGLALRDPDRAWMSALLRQTQGLWQRVDNATPATAAWRLERLTQGRVQEQLWLEADGLLWCGAGQACQRAPLTTQQRQALLNELAR